LLISGTLPQQSTMGKLKGTSHRIPEAF